MKSLIISIALMTIVSTSFAKTEWAQQEVCQNDPTLPIKVLETFGSLVTELVTQQFGEVSYDLAVVWTYDRGQWLASAEITVTRSTGISLIAYFRPSGHLISYEYFMY